MRLGNIQFAPIWDASGVEGFRREGYRHHKLFKLLFPGLFTFDRITFVAKTTPLESKAGNMPLLLDGITVRDFRPDCIRVNFLMAAMLNAVGLASPGARFLFEFAKWKHLADPFGLSFMAVGKTRAERMHETARFVKLAQNYLWDFSAPVALQINSSCPNVGHDPKEVLELLDEMPEALQITADLGIPCIPKFNALAPPERVTEIAEDENCAAVCVSNSIPYGECADVIDWKKLFGHPSPLAKYGGGGGSGFPIWPVVHPWVLRYCGLGATKPIIAGGGIIAPWQVREMFACGPQVHAVSIGTAANVRPWRMRGLIRTAYKEARRLGRL